MFNHVDRRIMYFDLFMPVVVFALLIIIEYRYNRSIKKAAIEAFTIRGFPFENFYRIVIYIIFVYGLFLLFESLLKK